MRVLRAVAQFRGPGLRPCSAVRVAAYRAGGGRRAVPSCGDDPDHGYEQWGRGAFLQVASAYREALPRRDWPVVAVLAPTGQTGGVTAEQLELISTDPWVMHGQAVLAGTRVPVSVILDCLAAGMTVEEIIAEYPVVTAVGVRAAAAYGAALAREELLPLPRSR